jgi:hypothetical protein
LINAKERITALHVVKNCYIRKILSLKNQKATFPNREYYLRQNLLNKAAMQMKKELYTLLKEIENYEMELLKVRSQIENLMKISDGLLFGQLGIDALIGIIPGIGEVYTLLASCWMFALAVKVKTPIGDILTLIFLTLVDIGFGFVPAAGDIIDVFLRVHSWFGSTLIEGIDRKLGAISRAKVMADNGEYQDLIALKNSLF